VWSQDEETGEVSEQRVLRTVVTPDQPVLEITFVDDSGQEETIRATGDHPFWVGERGWTPARELQPGGEVFQISGGWLRVGSATWAQQRETVYNFEVETTHTYFVGELGAWVHNNDCVGAQVLWSGSKAMRHIRSHARDAYSTAERLGFPITRSVRGAQSFIGHVVRSGERRIGTWGDLGQVQMHRLGDAVAIRRMNGEYVTNLDFARGGNIVQRWANATPSPAGYVGP